jgi:hypothetical protein
MVLIIHDLHGAGDDSSVHFRTFLCIWVRIFAAFRKMDEQSRKLRSRCTCVCRVVNDRRRNPDGEKAAVFSGETACPTAPASGVLEGRLSIGLQVDNLAHKNGINTRAAYPPSCATARLSGTARNCPETTAWCAAASPACDRPNAARAADYRAQSTDGPPAAAPG